MFKSMVGDAARFFQFAKISGKFPDELKLNKRKK